MCRSCFSVTVLCSGIPLPYSTGSPSRSSPPFRRYYEDAKTSLASQRRPRLYWPALPALDCVSSLASGGSRPESARWLFSRSSLLSPASFRGSLAWDLPCSRCAPCRSAVFSDPGGTLTPRHLAASRCCRRWPQCRRLPHNGHLGIQSHGLPARCVRFVPAFPLTTQHSLPSGG